MPQLDCLGIPFCESWEFTVGSSELGEKRIQYVLTLRVAGLEL